MDKPNVCDDTKQITKTFFNSLDKPLKQKYIAEDYNIVSTIKQQAPIQYIPHTPINDENSAFTNPDDFYNYAIKNKGFLKTICDQVFKTDLNNFNNDTFIIKAKSNNNIGRNIEKYPIPTTECEKRYAMLNPEYKCKGINKKGDPCPWVIKINGVCGNCNKKGLIDETVSEADFERFLGQWTAMAARAGR